MAFHAIQRFLAGLRLQVVTSGDQGKETAPKRGGKRKRDGRPSGEVQKGIQTGEELHPSDRATLCKGGGDLQETARNVPQVFYLKNWGAPMSRTIRTPQPIGKEKRK